MVKKFDVKTILETTMNDIQQALDNGRVRDAFNILVNKAERLKNENKRKNEVLIFDEEQENAQKTTETKHLNSN